MSRVVVPADDGLFMVCDEKPDLEPMRIIAWDVSDGEYSPLVERDIQSSGGYTWEPVIHRFSDWAWHDKWVVKRCTAWEWKCRIEEAKKRQKKVADR